MTGLPGLPVHFGPGLRVDIPARTPYRLLQPACTDLQILGNEDSAVCGSFAALPLPFNATALPIP